MFQGEAKTSTLWIWWVCWSEGVQIVYSRRRSGMFIGQIQLARVHCHFGVVPCQPKTEDKRTNSPKNSRRYPPTSWRHCSNVGWQHSRLQQCDRGDDYGCDLGCRHGSTHIWPWRLLTTTLQRAAMSNNNCSNSVYQSLSLVSFNMHLPGFTSVAGPGGKQ